MSVYDAIPIDFAGSLPKFLRMVCLALPLHAVYRAGRLVTGE